jgi:hypothetical protein
MSREAGSTKSQERQLVIPVKTSCIGFALPAVLLMAITSTATGQSYFYLWDNDAGNNTWGTGQNWGRPPGSSLGVNNVTPNAFFEELGLINNGNTVNVTTSQTQFSSSAADSATAAAGVTVDGVTAAGNGSRLNIASGGSLSLLTTYGPNGAPPSATPTAGTGIATINNQGSITVQPGGTLTVGRDIVISSGTLTVGGTAAGGQVSTGNLREAGANSAINLMGSAILNVSNGAVLNGTTTISGPNVVFNTPSISMSATAVFSPDITSPAVAAGTGHSVINVTGGVSLNGTLRPQFHNGVVPQLGDTWTLWDSAQMQGNFTVSDSSGAGAALPTGLRYAITTTPAGSVRGVKGQLTVENFLTAEVNRANGQVTIRNTNTTVGPGVTITGYQVGSPAGALRPASFTSAFGGTWEPANVTANSIGELNPTNSSTVGLGASNSLGSVYDPLALAPAFGTTPVADLTFAYTRSDGRTASAPVTYINNGLANTLVLQVDPTDGKARIVNDSTFNNIQFDGYQITSASNSLLTTWNSLQDQFLTGWEEVPTITTGLLAELNPTATTTVNAGQTAVTLAGLFRTAGGTQDLAFQFRVPGTGDYNSNGVVDAADYVVWRDKLGQMFALPNRDPANVGAVSMADYNSWRSHFGRSVGPETGVLNGVVRYAAFSSGGLPEPSTLAIVLLSIFGLAVARFRIKFVI